MSWEVSESPSFRRLAAKGQALTRASRDFTVKVGASQLYRLVHAEHGKRRHSMHSATFHRDCRSLRMSIARPPAPPPSQVEADGLRAGITYHFRFKAGDAV